MQKDIHFETLTIDDAMDFSFHYNSNVNVALSIHTENEIIYLLSGDLFLLVNEETYHMKPGDIALINAFEPMRF